MLKKDNEVLLRKLVEISMGKRSNIPMVPPRVGIRNSASTNKLEPLPVRQPSVDSEDQVDRKETNKTSRQSANANTTSSKSLNMHAKL